MRFKAYMGICMLLVILSVIHLPISAQAFDTATKESGDSVTYYNTSGEQAVAKAAGQAGYVTDTLETRSCANTYTNQTVSSYVSVTGCNTLTVQNVTVSNGSSLFLSAPGEITINGTFDVLSGGSLNYSRIPVGDNMQLPISAGTYSTAFQYSDTKNTTGYTNAYTGRSTHDVFYKFVITTIMDVTISHCGSGVSDTYLHLLDASGNRISYNDDNSSGCSNRVQQSYLTMPGLAPGTYYVVSEGYSQNGSITTNISGTIPAPAPPGDSRQEAIDAGTYAARFSYMDTRNTTDYSNQYGGQSTNDVFYKFVTTAAMDVTISHCGSEVSNTYLHLLNASGTRIAYNDDHASGCTNSAQAYLTVPGLAPGTYYVVSEGYSQNGNITTSITGNTGIGEPADPVIPPPSVSLSTNQNYILTRTARAATTSPSSLTTANSMQTVQYFDGLGRPVETVRIAASPERKDLVSYQKYDAFGRESETWLPADLAGTCGSFRLSGTVESAASAAYGNDARPYTEIKYEPSPLNRVEKAYGPGQNWSTRPVTTAYATNTSSGDLSCAYYYLSGNNPVKSGFYPAGQLYVVKTTSEDGHVSYEFTDKMGRVVLQRQVNEGTSPNHDTYYIYDDYGNLRYVLPPMAADASNLADAIAKYAYVYTYDGWRRCTEKKLPGANVIYYVYDKADRMVLSQDGVQRASNEWTFYKYDPLGRLILTGVLTNGSARETLAAAYRNVLVTESRGSAVMGYTNASPPSVTASQVLLANYYDNYTWNSTSALQQTGAPSGYGQPHSSAQGLLTGTVARTLNSTDKLLHTTFYYDYRGNLVGRHAENILSGYDHEYYACNFAGETEKKLLNHCNSANSEILSEVYTYEYDHAGRMKKKDYALNGGASVRMASYRYDNLGRLLTKYTGGVELSSYAYNIRGWMTSLSGQRFSESLSYSGQYGGNIASLTWNTDGRGSQGYTYTYDKLGRMKQAAYNGPGGRNYTESFTYDKHGNPLTISRYGRVQNRASYAYGPIDNLSMSAASYHGNRLIDVSESVNNQPDYDLMEFKKRSVASPHYAYDVNGNLTRDNHKNISTIQYNYLHLPKLVTFGDGKSITYVHDASGVKHEVKHTNPTLNPATSTTTYAANKIYEDGALSMVLTEDGYLKKQGNTYRPFYYLKDHLGSNRMVIDGTSGGVVQATDHYPFGMSFADNPPSDDQSVQRYKYTGKELDREHGLNLYDYHARMYDPAIGRFTTMDPLAEKYYSISPYVYCNNNPVKFVDLDGRSYDWPPFDPTYYRQAAASQHIEKSIKANASTIQQNATVGLLSMSDVNDATVLTTTITRGGNAINIDGTPATTVDKGFAALGTILPVISGSAVKNVFKSIGKALGIGGDVTKATKGAEMVLDRTKNNALRLDKNGNKIPDPEAVGTKHSQLGTKQGRKGEYKQAREFNEKGEPVRDIDFTNHGRPQNHTNPHQHRYKENPSGGTRQRGKEEPLN